LLDHSIKVLVRVAILVLAASICQTGVVGAPPSKSSITISLKTTMRQGRLVVLIDDVPVFAEDFQKPALAVSQTTTWDPLHVTPGKHRLSARVQGTKKTYHSATYDLNVSRTKASELRFLMKGDKLTVEVRPARAAPGDLRGT
jgi:hypothetical protein